MRHWPRTNATIYLIPVLFNKLPKKYISYESTGFVNAYMRDINRPFLDKHLFMVYESKSISSKEYYELENQMKGLPDYYCMYTYRIDTKFYKVFVYAIGTVYWNSDVASLLQNEWHQVSYQSRLKILKYWGLTISSEEHKVLFDLEVVAKVNFYDQGIKEEDPPSDLLFKVQKMASDEADLLR